MAYIDSIRKGSEKLICTLRKGSDLYYSKGSKVYGCKYDGMIYTCEHDHFYNDAYIVLDFGTQKVKVNAIYLHNIYLSLDDVKRGKSIDKCDAQIFVKKSFLSILADCIGRSNFHYYDAGANYYNIRRYKWNGYRANEVGFDMPDTIRYDGTTFAFTTPLVFENGTYGKKYECEEDNEIDFVPYGGNESVGSKKEKTIAFAASPFGKSINLNIEFKEENGKLSVEIKKIC